MSLNLPQVDVSTSGKFNLNIGVTPFARIAWIEFLNESPYTLTLQIGGINVQIPAWYDYPIQVQTQRNVPGNSIWQPIAGAQEPVTITPMLIANNLITSTSTILLTTLYTLGESPANTIPQALARQTYIPNTVNNVSGVASSVQNDGNTTGTSVVEATPTGYMSSAVSLLNQGLLYLGQNVTSESGEIILLDANGSSYNTTLQGGKGTFPLGLTANAINAQASNDLALNVPTGQRVVDSVNSVNIFEVNASGATVESGSLIVGTSNPKSTLANGSLTIVDSSGIQVILLTPSTQTATGSAGTVKCYQYLRGSSGPKITILVWNGFASTGNIDITLPVAYSVAAYIRTGNVGTSGNGGVSLIASTVAQNIAIISALALAGGTTSNQTAIYSFSQGEILAGFDTVRLLSTGGAGRSGVTIIEGY